MTASDITQQDICLLQLPSALLHSILVHLLQQDPKTLCALFCSNKALASAARKAALHVTSFSSKGNALFLTKQRQAVLPVALQHMLSALPNLQQLDLDHAYGCVDDGVLLSIAKHCKQLTRLQLRACQKISAAGLQDMAMEGLPELQELGLELCQDIGTGSFLHLLPQLRSINASYCHTLAAKEVSKVSGQLTELLVKSCELIDSSICKDLKQIRILNIARTAVGDQGLGWLQQCPHLQDLIVAPRSNNLWTDCAWSEAALSTFAAARPDVHIKQSWDL